MHENLGSELTEETGGRQLSDKPSQPLLILVILLGAGLWRVGWVQVRTAWRLDPRAVVEGRVIGGGSQPLSQAGETHRRD